MSDSLSRALVSVRATSRNDARVTVFARARTRTFGKGWSFDVEEADFTAAEDLLGAIAADVLGLFAQLARKRRLPLDSVEATLRAELINPLTHLGVVGAEGAPRYDFFSLRAYAESAAPSKALHALWDEALRRAPLLNTLRLAAHFEINFQTA